MKTEKMEGLKSKLYDLLAEYRQRGLSMKEVNECLEFAQIHFEEAY